MNKLRFFCIAACVCMMSIFLSCDKDKNKDDDSPKSSHVTSIDATVANANNVISEVEIVKLVIVDADDKILFEVAESDYVKGKFLIKLPDNIPSKYLGISLDEDYFPDGIKISKPNVEGVEAKLLGYKNKTESHYGSFWYEKRNEKNICIVDAYLIYVNNDVTITGTHEETYNKESTRIKKHNLSFKKGWNFYYYSFEQSIDGKTKTDQYTTTKPDDMKWYYYD